MSKHDAFALNYECLPNSFLKKKTRFSRFNEPAGIGFENLSP